MVWRKKMFSSSETMTLEQVAIMERARNARISRRERASLRTFTYINLLILVFTLMCAGLYLSFGTRLISFVVLLVIASSSLYAQAIICFLRKKWIGGTCCMTFFITLLMSLLSKVL